MKRVLIVSPSFPPLNTPDLQRVRMSLPYYRECGWEPIVLTVCPTEQEGIHEPALVETIPAEVQVSQTGAFPVRLGKLIGLRNLGLRCWLPFLLRGADLIRREKIDLVFFSTTQFVTFTLGRVWRAWLGVPYVIDLQDPWRTDYYERPGVRPPPGGWKYLFARVQAAFLEAWSFRRLAGFVSVSEVYLHDLCARYSWFKTIPARTLGFGASEADLAIARTLPLGDDQNRDPQYTHIVYTGAAGPITPHAVNLLFEALAVFRSRDASRAARLRFHFVGSTYAPAEDATPLVRPYAEQAGVGDWVAEVPGRVGHLECLRLQSEADLLLLAGSSDPAYSPSKLYPYFLAGRPILSIVFRNSYLESILRELNCSHIVYADSADRFDAIEELCRLFAAAADKDWAPFQADRNESLFRKKFFARSLTRQQCELFEQAVPCPGTDVRV